MLARKSTSGSVPESETLVLIIAEKTPNHKKYLLPFI